MSKEKIIAKVLSKQIDKIMAQHIGRRLGGIGAKALKAISEIDEGADISEVIVKFSKALSRKMEYEFGFMGLFLIATKTIAVARTIKSAWQIGNR